MNRMRKILACTLFFVAVASLSSCGKESRKSDRSRSERARTPQTECAEPNSVGDGLRCSCASDCLPGATCSFENDFGEPGGACIRSCTEGDGTCSEGATCLDFLAEFGAELACSESCTEDSECGALTCRDGACCLPGRCQRECEETSDCERGRICIGGFCQGHCVADEDCERGRCNSYSGLCGPTDETKAGLSEPCLVHDDCRSGYCQEGSLVCATSCSVSLGGCPEDALCIETTPGEDEGVCALPCDGDGSCDSGLSCVEGWGSYEPFCAALIAPEACEPASGIALDPCECDAQCAAGGTCVTEAEGGFPGGICHFSCTTEADCGDDEICNASNYCMPTCIAGECGPGRSCSSDGVCRPFCANNSECESNLCNTYSALCVQSEPVGAGVLGECAEHADCKSEFCASFGRCISLCSGERGACPDAAECVVSAGVETGVCTYSCAEDPNICKEFGLVCDGGYCM